MTTWLPRRTEQIVVPRYCSICLTPLVLAFLILAAVKFGVCAGHYKRLAVCGLATYGQGMSNDVIRLRDKLKQFSDCWSPRVVAELNDYQFKLAHLEGEFVWHAHAHTDEAFLVLAGALQIELRDRVITLEEGDLYVVPAGQPGRQPCAAIKKGKGKATQCHRMGRIFSP